MISLMFKKMWENLGINREKKLQLKTLQIQREKRLGHFFHTSTTQILARCGQLELSAPFKCIAWFGLTRAHHIYGPYSERKPSAITTYVELGIKHYVSYVLAIVLATTTLITSNFSHNEVGQDKVVLAKGTQLARERLSWPETG